jgi:hypothetical protein
VVVVAAHLFYLLIYFKVYLLNVLQAMNIVSTVNLYCKLDLKNIALSARNAEYNQKVYDRA